MNWETLQQLIRILAYAGGGYFLGEATAQGAEFQGAVSGLLGIAAFLWWAYQEHQKTKAK